MNSANAILIYKLIDDQIIGVAENNNAVSQSLIGPPLTNFDYENYDESKVCLNLNSFDQEHLVTLEQIGFDDDDSDNSNNIVKRLNFPTFIKCQNCNTNFPTKYQYQRHQCEYIDKAEAQVEQTIDTIKEEPKSNNDVFASSVCRKIFLDKSALGRHQEDGTGVNTCEFCNKHFVSDNRLRIHKENHCKKAGDISKFYRSDVVVWKCSKCHEVFSSEENASTHLSKNKHCQHFNSVKMEVDGNKENVEKISTELLLQCEFCNRTFSDKNFLLLHQRSHTTSTNYECASCFRTFDSYSTATGHWLKKCCEFTNVFYLPRLSYCEYCDRTFKSHEILYNHKIKKKHYTPKLHVINEISKASIESKETINKLIQDVLITLDVPINNNSTSSCSSSSNEGSEKNSNFAVKTENNEDQFGAKSGRKRRLNQSGTKTTKPRSTDEGFKYQCERCVKVFDSIADLEQHRANEHVATFCCEECGQTLGSAKALLIHCRAHKSLKPYVCDTCGRSYSQTSHLWQHMRFHQGIKPFACPHEGCEARYTIRPDLKDHIRKVHTRERPFKCNVCNKCFLTGSVYYQHRLIHTNDRRYGCEICNKRFFRADALNNHRRIHTDERPYPCNVCGREFRQKGDRNKHVRTQHPENFGVANNTNVL